MIMKKFLPKKVLSLLMAAALLLPLLTSCDPNETGNSDDPNNPGGSENVTALVGTKWNCDTTLSMAQLSISGQLEFLAATTGKVTLSVMGTEMSSINVNYTYDGSNGTITPADYDGTVAFHKTDEKHITVAMTADFLGGNMESNPYSQLFAIFGGSINLVFALNDGTGGGTGGGEEPSGNFISYDGVHNQISMAIMNQDEGSYVYSFVAGSLSFSMVNPTQLQSGNYSFLSNSEMMRGTAGLFALVASTSNDGVDFINNGTLELVLDGEQYTIDITATTVAGKAFILHYEGAIADMSSPTGSGTLNTPRGSFTFTHAYTAVQSQGVPISVLAFSDDDDNVNVSFAKMGSEFGTGSMQIASSEDELLSGKVLCEVSVYDPENDIDIEFTATGGNITISQNNGSYTVNFGGTSTEGAFNGNYNGGISSLSKAHSIIKMRKNRK